MQIGNRVVIAVYYTRSRKCLGSHILGHPKESPEFCCFYLFSSRIQ